MVPISDVRVTAYDFEPTVEAGDVVRIRHLRLRQPSGFRNPGAFDYGGYLARRGIYATGSLSKNEHIEVVQHASSVLLERFSQFKIHLADRIAAAMDTDEAAITTAMALGVRSSRLRCVKHSTPLVQFISCRSRGSTWLPSMARYFFCSVS